jgi:type VI secretion system secreted protein VgrG
VQYRESDIDFACRLMEEEGIYTNFKHGEGGHPMVVANSPRSHVELPTGSTITYKNRSRAHAHEEDIIYDWGKTQEVTVGKYTLWDHCFELPHKHLEADRGIQESVQVGQADHKLKFGENGRLAVYDWPGEYAQRFDGVDKGGGEKPADLQRIFEDNQRTVGIRMQQEAAAGVVVRGAGNCRQLVSGHKFTLATLPSDRPASSAKADGVYVLTAVSHRARAGQNYRSGGGNGVDYSNTFTCLPEGLPFRPARSTARPVVPGSQTAVVVGPPAEEIFTDKYGRIKVQFHWDREGKRDADSSCWVRVATTWAGKQWGVVHIPRVGQEVIVDFLEGDPDQPIVVGSVYNAEMMPPYGLPGSKTQTGIKTRSTPGGTGENFNEIRFEDKKGQEQLYVHAERNQDNVVEADASLSVGHDRTKTVKHDETTNVKHDRTETVGNDETITIVNNRTEDVQKGNETITVHKGNRTINVDTGDQATSVKKGHHKVQVDKGNATLDVLTGDRKVRVATGNYQLTTDTKNVVIQAADKIVETGNNEVNISSPNKVTIRAGNEILLGVGDSTITLTKEGITISGPIVNSTATTGDHTICGKVIKLN